MANTSNGANLGFETDLWRAADALRPNMDAAEYKHFIHHLSPSRFAGFVLAKGYEARN
jgi:type I restriction-modification system DNA methylase subunit